MTTFITLRGQFDNIGDVILRRQLAGWIPGPCIAYVGMAPTEFIDGLQLGGDCKVERSFGAFARALTSAPRGSSYIFKPGETQLTLAGMKENVGLLPLFARLRARGGKVLRVGVGARGSSQFYARLCEPSVRLSNISKWRDARTLETFGSGEVMPDLAFAEGSDPADWGIGRGLLVVSLRGDRPEPREDWFSALAQCAAERSLTIKVVSQVRRDDARAQSLADRLNVASVLCGSRPSLEIEYALREIYRRSALTVSNRLHVLIAALTEGSPVSACVPGGSQKVADHLAVVGLDDVAIDADNLSSEDCAAVLLSAAVSERDIAQIVGGARTSLLEVHKQFTGLLDSGSTESSRSRAGS